MASNEPVLRLLVIEDNPGRIELFEQWFPLDIKPVFAKSAGRALGILQRDRGYVYMGILLDHDLYEQPASQEDLQHSGTDVVKAILEHVHPDTPILVHSMNNTRALAMVKNLEAGGFYCHRVPMELLTREKLVEWIDDCRDTWNYTRELNR